MPKLEFIDQMNRVVKIDSPPKRIISLVPSQTELMYDLGLEEQVVGITKFCVRPPHWLKTKTRIGGTKKLNIPLIHKIKPDLIVANKEENNQSEIAELERYFPIWISDVKNLKDAHSMISSIGEITNTTSQAHSLNNSIAEGFNKLSPISNQKKVLYLIWQNPFMAAGSDTFIHEMIGAIGLQNALGSQYLRYPEISENEIKELQPDYILLSSEPFPFKAAHKDKIQSQFPFSKVISVDGEMFSWYGSRLVEAPKYFKQFLYSF